MPDIVDSTQTYPPVYPAVRAVGAFRPKFSPQQGRVFSDELQVFGTAFWLREPKVLITCAHVIQKLTDADMMVVGMLVIGHNGEYQRAKIQVIDHEHDLAVLRLVDPEGRLVIGESLDKEAQTGLRIGQEYPDVGTHVAYAGFPGGLQLLDKAHAPTYAEGVVGVRMRELNFKRYIQISGPVMPGFSGSPMVATNNPLDVLGIVADGPDTGPHGSVFRAVSWEHIRAIAQLVATSPIV